MRTIFVSSTFADMQMERDTIRDKVAPMINAEAHKYNDHIEFCDLRWGIDNADMSPEEADRKVLDVCLDEIDRSNPPIIILLGDRYGWIPNEDSIKYIVQKKGIEIDNFRKSVTALEAEYGVGRHKNALVYFRKVEFASGECSKTNEVEDEEHHRLLTELKEWLSKKTFCKVKQYSITVNEKSPVSNDIDNFANMVANDLKTEMLPYWKEFASMTEFERERERQWTFIREKNNVFFARKGDAKALLEKINENQNVICEGKSGSGKSTLFSHIAVKAEENGWDVLPFVGGLTDESNDAMDILRNVIYYIEENLSIIHIAGKEENYTGFGNQELTVVELQRRLIEISNKIDKKLLVMVDALDQLYDDEIRNTCGFIPIGLSNKIQFFITTTYIEKVKFPLNSYEYHLCSLTKKDREEAINGVLQRVSKELNNQVKEQILNIEAASSPYFISMIVQRLCLMDIQDFERIRNDYESHISATTRRQIEIINSSPADLEGMASSLMNEAASRIDKNMIAKTIYLLATSRYGLRRSDLAIILKDEWNELKFSHLLNYLHEDFQIRSDGRIDFLHKTIRNGLRKDLQRDTDVEKMYHQAVVDYLKGVDSFDNFRMNEILYHCIKADDKESFLDYIRKFNYDDNDSIIINAASESVRIACLEDRGAWLGNLIINYDEFPLFRFLCNQFLFGFRDNNYEQEIKVDLIKLVKSVLDDTSEYNKHEYEKARVIYNLAENICISWEWIIDDSIKEWGAEKLIESAKRRYNSNDIIQKSKLFEAYYKALFCYKSSDNKHILQKGTKVAKEGEQLLSEDLLKLLYHHESNAIAFFGCVGEIYYRLGSAEECKNTYLTDLEYRKKYSGENSDYSLLMIATGCGNVVKAYMELFNRNKFDKYISEAKKYAFDAVEYLDKLNCKKNNIGAWWYDHIGDAYRMKTFFLLDKVGENQNNNEACRCLIESNDYFRKAYKIRRKSDTIYWLTKNYVELLFQINVKENQYSAFLDKFKIWIDEDEKDVGKTGFFEHYNILKQTCYYAANFINRYSIADSYNIALNYCSKGISTSNEIKQNFANVPDDTLLQKFYSLIDEINKKVEKHKIERIFKLIDDKLKRGSEEKNMGNTDVAKKWFLQAKDDIEVKLQENSDSAIEAQLYENLGDVEFELNEYPSANKYYKKSLELHKEIYKVTQGGGAYVASLSSIKGKVDKIKAKWRSGKKCQHCGGELKSKGIKKVCSVCNMKKDY